MCWPMSSPFLQRCRGRRQPDREHGAELACVLVDPMPNRAGLAPADKAYLEALRAVTSESGRC